MAMLGLQSWAEWRAHAMYVRQTETSLVNLASSIMRDAEDTVDIADAAVTGIVTRLEAEGTASPVLDALNRKLPAQVALSARFDDLAVLGPNGDRIASSALTEPGNFADRAYFRHHRDDPDPGVFIGPAVKSRLNGRWIITVSRRFRSASGDFGGVVVGTIELSRFEEHYRAYDLGPDSSIVLSAMDGTLLARRPARQDTIGRNFSNATVFTKLPGHPSGSFWGAGVVDGRTRVAGYQRSGRYPLVAIAGMAEDEALAAWRTEVRTHMLIAAVLAGVIGFLGHHLSRQVARIQSANERVRDSEARYRLLTEVASDMVAQVGPDGRWRYVSPASRRLLGMPPEELLGARILDFAHPDEQAGMLDRIGKLMDGQNEEHNPVFRILRPDGAEAWIEASSRVTRHPETGAPDGYVSVLRDVTRRVAAEAALRETETLYRLLADNSTDMIVVFDRDYVRRYVSPSCRELIGYQPEELVGVSGDLVLHPEDAGRVKAGFQALIAAGGPTEDRVTWRVLHRDGHWVWIESQRKVIAYAPDGLPMEVCSISRDIDSRVAAETALRESDERYRMLLQSGAVTEAIYMLDPDGTIESWNAAAEQITGYAAADIIGRNIAVLFPPDDTASGEPARLLAEALDKGRVTTEAWRVRQDGTRFLAHISIDAVHRDDGSLRGFAKVDRDITSQRIEEEQRAIMIEAAPNGMMIVDEAGIITLANSKAEQIFDYPPGALNGRPAGILVPEDPQGQDSALRAALAGGRAVLEQRVFAARKRDGGPVTIDILLSPVKTPRGAIVVASLLDVTERQRQAAEQREAEWRERHAIETANASLDRLARHLTKARDRADHANRAKSRFLAGMSHELRTPLNGILGYAQLLQLEGGLNDKQAGRIDAMLEAGKHLLLMINKVLDLSEIESGHVALRPVTFDTRSVAGACLDLVRPAAEAKGLVLSLSVAPDTPWELVADATRLRQVLLNLLGNAAKFTSRGTIELRLRPSADRSRLRIEVVDTGAGVPAAQRARLFQEFERLDTDATRAAEGAGLGLSLSARIVALMGGALGHDDNPAGGSVFWFELPLATPAAAMATAPAVRPVAAASAPAGGLRVLVVDDMPMNREIARAFLCAAGHEITCAESGAEAVAAVSNTDFDVVLMDVRMPGMDGLEAARRIRRLDGARGQVPIVAVTAQVFTEQVAECQEAGMDSHLAKPFELDALLTTVLRAAATPRRRDGSLVLGPVRASAAPVTPPVVDRETFARTAAQLPAGTVTGYLRNIAAFCDMLLLEMQKSIDSTDWPDALVETTHQFTGSAGMFGFQRLAEAGWAFERAVRSGGAEASVTAASLAAAAEDTRKELLTLAP